MVRRVDDERIDILKRIFLDMDYAEEEAFIGARVAYFHQVGYYALALKETFDSGAACCRFTSGPLPAADRPT